MLLHNQTNKPIQWEADGVKYQWEPHGSCEVPECWRVNLRDQGFPVDVTPVTPQRRAEQAVTEQQEALAKSERMKLQSKLADAEARVVTAKKEAEAAQSREEKAVEALAVEKAARATLEDQLRIAKSDAAEYEKMCAAEGEKSAALEKQLQTLKARAEVEKSPKK